MAGLRVVRGPDWKWDDQDGGEGYCGTSTGNKTKPGWINILWDGGRKDNYRAGANDACDLLVLDNGPAGVHHPGVMCDACNENNVRGLRWKCADCPDYDLCTECYGNDKHDLNHRFKRINTPPSSTAENVGRRQNAVKRQSRGLYTGATVVRGENWDKGNQDGGIGSVGTVTQVGYVTENNQDKAALVVHWAKDPTTRHIYRRGLGGNVDVKYKSAAIGWNYYRDHLPSLRDVSAISKRTLQRTSSEAEDAGDILAKLFAAHLMSLTGAMGDAGEIKRSRRQETLKRFSVGDVVKLNPDLDAVQELQKGHGGFNILMIPALGKVGVVKEIDEDGDVKVKFGVVDWTLNPAALTKQSVQAQRQAEVRTVPSNTQSAYKNGDRVVISKDVSTVKELQNGHGGWSDAMRPFTGTEAVGVVRGVDSDNDIMVAFGDKSFLLNPAVCSAPPKKPKLQNVPSGSKFKVGDRVSMDKDIDFVQRMQKGHGGFHSSMKKAATSVGVVKEIDGDGDLKVQFDDNLWTFNPEVCHTAKTNTPTRLKTLNLNKDDNIPKTPDSATPSRCHFSIDDHVRFDKDIDFVKRMQSGHGGWNDDMRKEMLTVGRVVNIDGDGDIDVTFRDKKWTLNPEVCHKAEPHEAPSDVRPKVKDKNVNVSPSVTYPFKRGDKVKMNQNVDKIKHLQKGHGGWNEGMLMSITKVGRVIEFDGDGDVKVDFDGTEWTLNPEVCEKYDKSQAYVNVTPKSKDVNVSKNVKPPVDSQVPSSSGTSSSARFAVDDQIKLQVQVDKLRVLQRGHGGWNDSMKKVVGEIGILKAIDADGDLKVKFPSGTFSFNPEACMSLDSAKNKPTVPPRKPAAPRFGEQNSTKFNPGDCVKIVLDVENCIKLQRGHGGWNGAMALAIGKVGVVSEVLSSGDLNVKFGDNSWTFNSALFMLVDAGEGSQAMPGIRRDKDSNSNRNSRPTTTTYQCPICMERGITVVFNCGHGTCDTCSKSIDACHMCRQPIALRTKMFL